MDDFPNIYIKDPNVGIMYELEDLNEVTDNSVLALNVEALEQIKKHIDQNIGELTKEIREIKKSFSENTKLLRHNSIIANNTPPSPRPSESHFTQLAKKVLENVKKQKDSDDKKVTEEHVLKVAKEIKDQYDEVQNLRRDLGVMRQVYTEFQENSKKTFETLLARTENFKKVALTKNISSARTFIEAGKAKVDSKTRALLTKVDDLQDLIDNLKLDVVQRRSKPKDTIIQHVKNEPSKFFLYWRTRNIGKNFICEVQAVNELKASIERLRIKNSFFDSKIRDIPLPLQNGANGDFPSFALAPGKNTLIPIWVRGDKIGKYMFRFLFIYESEDNDSVMSYRSLRYFRNTQVQQSLKVNSLTRPSARGSNEFILCVEVENLQTRAEFHLYQFSSISPLWTVSPVNKETR
ncbi:5405_t:CDS:2 [Entrophospora sp. SA101]|nr:5405_t:CDS:2 [Entrophospora sp. SA101]